MLAVSEYFMSIQGEGQNMGRPAFFLRLAGCNLLCGGPGTDKDKQLHNGATWRCDTIEVWRKGTSWSNEELFARMETKGFSRYIEQGAHLIITGGEPLLQGAAIADFLGWLENVKAILSCVEIETNGTMLPNEELDLFVDFYNVSPKLLNSGHSKDEIFFPDVIEWFNKDKRTIFKYVCSEISDLVSVNELVLFNFIKRHKVWIMPAASTQQELKLRNTLLISEIIAKGFNYSSRLQIDIWNETTGV